MTTDPISGHSFAGTSDHSETHDITNEEIQKILEDNPLSAIPLVIGFVNELRARVFDLERKMSDIYPDLS